MADNKRRPLPSRISPRRNDKTGSLKLSKVNYFLSDMKNEPEVKPEFECPVDGMDIVKEEEIREVGESNSQSGRAPGSRTKPIPDQSQSSQYEPAEEANLPKNKKRKRPQRRQLERAAELGLTEKDLPESAYERAKLLSKLRKRKVQASETPVEKAERRRREAERQRIRRANEDPEKRIKRLKADAEQKKIQNANLTPEQAEARRQRIREKKRESYQRLGNAEKRALKRANETPEQKEKRLRKLKEQNERYNEQKRFSRLEKKLMMTEEEKAEERARNFFKKQALEAKMTQEELEAYKERRKELSKEYLKNLSGEKLARHRANVYKAMKKFYERNKERHKRKLAEDPLYRAKVRLNYRIVQAKQKLKRDLVRDGASEEVIKEELRKLAERMRAEPLPPPETVSEYKPRSKRSVNEASTSFKCFDESVLFYLAPTKVDLPINRTEENPVQEESQENNFAEDDYFQEREDYEPPSPEPSPPAPELSPGIAEETEERNEAISSSKPYIQTPILSPVPSPTRELARITTSSGVSSSPCPVPTTRELPQLQQPTPVPHKDQSTCLNLNWKCPICRMALSSKDKFLEHYNSTHKRSQKSSL